MSPVVDDQEGRTWLVFPNSLTMISRKKTLLLFLLAFSTGTLLLRQSAHFSW